jgi:hypothetical protein
LKRIIIILSTLILVSILVVVYLFNSAPSEPTQVDTSWISTVEQLLQEAQPYPPNNSSLSHPANPQILNVYLNENGTEQLIYYGSGSNLSNYLYDLMESVNVERDPTVAEYYLSKVMLNDKVVSLHYNLTLVSQNYSSQRFYVAYFVLEDNLNEGLTGAIFVRNTQASLGHLSFWVKAK